MLSFVSIAHINLVPKSHKIHILHYNLISTSAVFAVCVISQDSSIDFVFIFLSVRALLFTTLAGYFVSPLSIAKLPT